MKHKIFPIIFVMLVCSTNSKEYDDFINWAKLNLTVEYTWSSRPHELTVMFSDSMLMRFIECLCNESSLNCSIVFNEENKVLKIENEPMTLENTSNEMDYLCEFDNYIDNIVCMRQVLGSSHIKSPFYINPSHCPLLCVEISWIETQRVTLSKNDIFVMSERNYKPPCLNTTVRTTIHSTTLKSTPPQTTPLVQRSSYKNDIVTFSLSTKSFTDKLQGESDDNDCNIPIIIGVVAAVFAILAVVAGAVFYRKRQHKIMKHKQSNKSSKNNSNSGGESAAISLRSLTDNTHSRIKLSKGGAEDTNDKINDGTSSHHRRGRSNDENSQKIRGDSDEKLYFSESNLDHYSKGLTDQYQGVYKNLSTVQNLTSSVPEYSTTGSVLQNNSQSHDVAQQNLTRKFQGDTYSNSHGQPAVMIDPNHKLTIQGTSSVNYELATNMNRPAPDDSRGQFKTSAPDPSGVEYAKLGDKRRDFTHPYNILPETDSPTLAAYSSL